MKNYLPFFLILATILVGCCKALPPQMRIVFNDSNGNNLLDNANPTDSSWAWYVDTTDLPKPIRIVDSPEGVAALFEDGEIQSYQTFYLQIDPTDTDTITVNYEVKGGNCNLQTKIHEIVYNGNTFEGGKKGEVIRIIKY